MSPQKSGAAIPSDTKPNTWFSSSGTSSSTIGKTTTQPTDRSSFSSSGASGINRAASKQAYKDYTRRFAKPGNPIGQTTDLAPSRTYNSYNRYRNDRDAYYGRIGWQPPNYVFSGHSSYGMWDSIFLWYMLSNIGGASFFYNNANDQGVRIWRQQAEEQSKTNDELKTKLDILDYKLTQMAKDSIPVTPGALPADVDSTLAQAAERVVHEESEILAKSDSGWITWLLITVAVGCGGALLLLKRRNS
ncbi:hypothetical protein DSUL_20166 [Desulfovibrionales bacterium]